jgi:hypothetical protein
MTNDFEALTTEELYLLHQEVAAVLRKKLLARKMHLRGDSSNYNRRRNADGTGGYNRPSIKARLSALPSLPRLLGRNLFLAQW